MIEIQGLKATPFQTFNYSIEGGTIYFTLIYRPAVKMWYIDVEYNDFVVKGLRVCFNLNLLYQFQKIIPFGLYVRRIEGVEPFLIDDFSTRKFTLNILSEDEVIEINDAYEEYKAEL